MKFLLVLLALHQLSAFGDVTRRPKQSSHAHQTQAPIDVDNLPRPIAAPKKLIEPRPESSTELEKWIKELDDDEFAVRQSAFHQISELVKGDPGVVKLISEKLKTNITQEQKARLQELAARFRRPLNSDSLRAGVVWKIKDNPVQKSLAKLADVLAFKNLAPSQQKTLSTLEKECDLLRTGAAPDDNGVIEPLPATFRKQVIDQNRSFYAEILKRHGYEVKDGAPNALLLSRDNQSFEAEFGEKECHVNMFPVHQNTAARTVMHIDLADVLPDLKKIPQFHIGGSVSHAIGMGPPLIGWRFNSDGPMRFEEGRLDAIDDFLASLYPDYERVKQPDQIMSR